MKYVHSFSSAKSDYITGGPSKSQKYKNLTKKPQEQSDEKLSRQLHLNSIVPNRSNLTKIWRHECVLNLLSMVSNGEKVFDRIAAFLLL